MKTCLSLFYVVFAFFLAFSCGDTPKSSHGNDTPPPPQKIGLVLGGGGAKGNASLGALKVIEESGIKIDYIAGTSIGAIIGALYAAGYSVDEIEDLFCMMKWTDLLRGKRMEEKFDELLSDRGVYNFKDLKIPFRCVAVNVNTGKDEVFAKGEVYKAIRASMSIPPVYTPVEVNGEEYVDGGFINNLPVDVVKAMGAVFVIARDVQQEKEETDFQNLAEKMNSRHQDDSFANFIGDVFGKEYEFMVNYFKYRPDTIKYNKNKREVDLYINPDLTNFNAASFGRNNSRLMFDRGEDEARKYIKELRKLK